jgi:hypothetical protein
MDWIVEGSGIEGKAFEIIGGHAFTSTRGCLANVCVVYGTGMLLGFSSTQRFAGVQILKPSHE